MFLSRPVLLDCYLTNSMGNGRESGAFGDGETLVAVVDGSNPHKPITTRLRTFPQNKHTLFILIFFSFPFSILSSSFQPKSRVIASTAQHPTTPCHPQTAPPHPCSSSSLPDAAIRAILCAVHLIRPFVLARIRKRGKRSSYHPLHRRRRRRRRFFIIPSKHPPSPLGISHPSILRSRPSVRHRLLKKREASVPYISSYINK